MPSPVSILPAYGSLITNPPKRPKKKKKKK
jgi:hypothetical protein